MSGGREREREREGTSEGREGASKQEKEKGRERRVRILKKVLYNFSGIGTNAVPSWSLVPGPIL